MNVSYNNNNQQYNNRYNNPLPQRDIRDQNTYRDNIPNNHNIPRFKNASQPSFKAPYGINFGEEKQVMEKERKQYREDLDYLIGLRRPYGEMTQKEWEEYHRKIDYMNDVNTNIIYII